MSTPEQSDSQIDETVLETMFSGDTCDMIHTQIGIFNDQEDLDGFHLILLRAKYFHSLRLLDYDQLADFVDNEIPPACQEYFSFRSFVGHDEIDEFFSEILNEV